MFRLRSSRPHSPRVRDRHDLPQQEEERGEQTGWTRGLKEQGVDSISRSVCDWGDITSSMGQFILLYYIKVNEMMDENYLHSLGKGHFKKSM